VARARTHQVEWETSPLDQVAALPLPGADRALAHAVYCRWRDPASQHIGEMMSLGISASLAERIVVGQYLARKPPLVIDDFVAHWALAAQETARGYRSSRAQFQGDLLLRDALVLMNEELPAHVRLLLEAALRPRDELFFAHTLPVAGCATEDAAVPGTWWGRVPRDAPGFTDEGQD